jgi:hypothetical protein
MFLFGYISMFHIYPCSIYIHVPYISMFQLIFKMINKYKTLISFHLHQFETDDCLVYITVWMIDLSVDDQIIRWRTVWPIKQFTKVVGYNWTIYRILWIWQFAKFLHSFWLKSSNIQVCFPRCIIKMIMYIQ